MYTFWYLFLGDSLVFNLISKFCFYSDELTLQKLHVAPVYPSQVGYVNYWAIRGTHLHNILLPKCGVPHWRGQLTFLLPWHGFSHKSPPPFLLPTLLAVKGTIPLGLAAQPMSTAPRQDFPPCLYHFPFSPSEHGLFSFPEN